MDPLRPAELELHFPTGMREREAEMVAQRRTAAASADESPSSPRPKVGLALSGGGIRSATLSLGLVQALARRDLLPHIDYLSTVSGGGYLGSFLGSLFARKHLPGGYQPTTEQPGDRHAYVKQVLSEERTAPLAWLRQNGRYLTPNGNGDVWLAIAVALRNWISVLVVMVTLALTIALGSHLLMGWTQLLVQSYAPTSWHTFLTGPQWIGSWLWWSPWFLAPLAIIVVWVIPTGWAYWLVPMARAREGKWDWSNVVLPCVVTVVTLLACVVLLVVDAWKPGLVADWLVLVGKGIGLLALLTLIYFLLVSKLTMDPPVFRSRISLWNARGLMVVVALLLCAVIDTCGRTLYALWVTQDMWPWLVATATALGGVYSVIQRFTQGSTSEAKKPAGKSKRVIAGVLGIVFHLLLLSGVSMVSFAIAYHGEVPVGDPGRQLVSADTVQVPLVTDGDGRVRAQLPTAETAAADRVAVDQPTRTAEPNLWTIGYAGGFTLLMTIGYAFVTSFINQSSLAHTYASRLTRSYLGATNPGRQDLSVRDTQRRVINAVPGDDLRLRPAKDATDSGYQPHLTGGPLHLINITINETLDARSGIQQLDRKGVPLAFGPAGVSVSVGHHARWNTTKEQAQPTRDTYYLSAEPRPEGAWRVFENQESQAEALSVGQLVGISGAAFSTGIGSQTSLALSLLCGLFNIRTGHWWQSGSSGAFSRFPFVQYFVLSEWLARFPGTSWNYWYLSDGGHFENLACYELIRRRLPFIICCDHGEDPKGELEDLGGLVRKARLDFHTDVTFLDRTEAHALVTPALRDIIGGLDDLRSTPATDDQPAQAPRACAALARLRYADGSTGTLLFIKPGLIGGEPEDIRYYQRSNPTYPHEPTINQFFNEAQWESYRRLGEFMADQLFGHDQSVAGWNPARMKPLA